MANPELEKLIYDDVKADVECEGDAENPFQEGYSVGFNDCRARVMAALLAAGFGPTHGPDVMPDKELRELIAAIEAYRFECEAGPLENCVEWIELKKISENQEALALPPTSNPVPL